MKICFVSNYINHHQIPFCNAMCKETAGDFLFIQTEPMEEERVQMGWQEKECPDYVHCYYEEEAWCRQQIRDCDVLLFGGCDDEGYIEERLGLGRIIIRISERLYKTGQWKAVSPRGLLKKYKDHTRYRKAPVYLLCAGGYVASDFRIVRAYPGKMFCWGYFPETKQYDIDALLNEKGYVIPGLSQRIPYILWAARFIDWKHPERALEVARYLKEKGLCFHLDMVGGGAMEEEVRALLHTYELEDCVTLLGYRTPAEVRELMEKADIYLMTSDRQEGWGAVANEAMNSGCALVADNLPGAVPYLVRQGYNGYIYEDGNQEMLNAIVEKLICEEAQRKVIGKRAYRTITDTWNAENAAGSLMKLIWKIIDELCGEADDREADGRKVQHSKKRKWLKDSVGGDYQDIVPCEPAPVISERRPVPPGEFAE